MDPFLHQLLHSWPREHWDNTRILIACSGGPDSIALASAFETLQPRKDRLEVAHFHHGLRAETADRDARFVENWCFQRGISFHLGHADADEMASASIGEGLESAARQLRYRFLVPMAERRGARYLVTGHTLDDQAETVLHHLLRGSGLNGLSGMRRHRAASPAVTLVRPLLETTRKNVEQYLERIGQLACYDEHNQSDQFLRSRLRNELLPLLEQEYHSGVRQSLTRLARIAWDAQEAIAHAATQLLERCLIEATASQVTLRCEPIRGIPVHLRRELFVQIWQSQCFPQQAMTFDHWQRLADLTEEAPTPLDADLPGAIRASRRNFLLTISRQPEVMAVAPASNAGSISQSQ